MPLVAAQSTQVAASAMDVGAPLLDGRALHSIRRRHMFCFVTCNGKTEITESVQIILEPVFDVESDGDIHF